MKARIKQPASPALSRTICSRLDTSMVTAPRDGRLLNLTRYPDHHDKTVRFVGRWDADPGWWKNEAGHPMTRVHSWAPLSENSKDQASDIP